MSAGTPTGPRLPSAAGVAQKIEGAAEDVAKVVAGAPAPRTLAEARLEVQRSRARIEATLDRLENRVVETKETIQRKVDITRPVREFARARPLIAIGAAVAIGLFLGTRGGNSDDEDEDDYGFDKRERRALEDWRKRRRKMLLAEAEDAHDVFEDEEDDEPPGRVSRFFRAIGHEAAGVVLGIVGAEVAERVVGARSDHTHVDGDEFDDD